MSGHAENKRSASAFPIASAKRGRTSKSQYAQTGHSQGRRGSAKLMNQAAAGFSASGRAATFCRISDAVARRASTQCARNDPLGGTRSGEGPRAAAGSRLAPGMLLTSIPGWGRAFPTCGIGRCRSGGIGAPCRRSRGKPFNLCAAHKGAATQPDKFGFAFFGHLVERSPRQPQKAGGIRQLEQFRISHAASSVARRHVSRGLWWGLRAVAASPSKGTGGLCGLIGQTYHKCACHARICVTQVIDFIVYQVEGRLYVTFVCQVRGL